MGLGKIHQHICNQKAR